MTKEEFKSCLNNKFYDEVPKNKQEYTLNKMYDIMPFLSAYTVLETKETKKFNWNDNCYIKDMTIEDWLIWRRQINQLYKQIDNDKQLKDLQSDFV